MKTAMDLLALLRRRGLDVRTDGASILVSPASGLDSALREAIALHRPALLLILAGKGPPPGRPLYYQPDPAREKVTIGQGRQRRRIRATPRYYTWEGAPAWFRMGEEGS